MNNTLLLYDYMLFVQIWPSAIIKEDNLKYNFTNDYFTVDKFLPKYNDGSSPDECNSTQVFNLDLLRNLFTDLNKYWTDFINPPDFWKHNFDKYLVCYNTKNPYKYFWWGLFLRDKFNLYEILKKDNIEPSNKLFYNTKIIEKSIRDAVGFDIVLTCNSKDILTEVGLCMNKYFELINCPINAYNNRCKKNFIWYSKSNNQLNN